MRRAPHASGIRLSVFFTVRKDSRAKEAVVLYGKSSFFVRKDLRNTVIYGKIGDVVRMIRFESSVAGRRALSRENVRAITI